MTIFDAILQGIVQGLTEFLPVSSSGHLSLLQHFTGRGGEAGGSFSIMLHFGTLIAVFIAFWPTIWALIREAFAMGAKEYGIMINRDMTLSRGLYLPANAAVEICGAGPGEYTTVTVPYGTTLTVGGRLTISLNGTLIVEGKYAGNLPIIAGNNSRFEWGEDADILSQQFKTADSGIFAAGKTV